MGAQYPQLVAALGADTEHFHQLSFVAQPWSRSSGKEGVNRGHTSRIAPGPRPELEQEPAGQAWALGGLLILDVYLHHHANLPQGF